MPAARAPGIPAYSGPERRSRITLVTRNTEYHLHEGLCVAVRDKATGRWLLRHAALRRVVSGVVRAPAARDPSPAQGQVQLGDVLLFAAEGRGVVTTTLTAIDRPAPSTVAGYPV